MTNIIKYILLENNNRKTIEDFTMKKIPFFLTLIILSLAPIHAQKTVSERAQELITSIKYLFKKSVAQEQETSSIGASETKILSINVGYLPIKNTITDYDQYFFTLKKFADNPEIDYILLDINSGGGSIATAEILAERIKNIKVTKPVICFISDMGCSAAYLIASATSYIIAPASAQIGALGALIAFDYKPQYLYITSAPYKAPIYKEEGVLDEKFLEYAQDSIDATAEIFFSAVASCRPINVETIRNFQAKKFNGKQALAMGLIDEVGTIEAVIQKITSEIETKNNHVYEKITFLEIENHQPKVMTTFTTIH